MDATKSAASIYECGNFFVHILQKKKKRKKKALPPLFLKQRGAQVVVLFVCCLFAGIISFSFCIVKTEYLQTDGAFVKVGDMMKVYTKSPHPVLRKIMTI